MHFRTKYVPLVAAATALPAATTACGSSSSKPALTADQVSAQLLTAKDEPDWEFSPDSDQKSTPPASETVSGGSACQTFSDASSFSPTRYGTTDNVLRTFLKSNSGDSFLDDVAVLPSSAKAAALLSDLTAGLKGCQSFSTADGKTTFTVKAFVDVPTGDVGYALSSPGTTYTTVLTTDAVQVGNAVVMITFLGTASDDAATVKQTVTHAAEVQAAHLKAAQG